MSDQFIVKVSVKPYIKKFLQNNCGDPVDLSHLPEIKELFNSLLRKTSRRSEVRIRNNHYSEEIDITISEDAFKRFGWGLTKTNTVKFNYQIEKRVKLTSRLFISNNKCLGIPVAKSIREFQELFNYTDDEFQYETIKKDFLRHGSEVDRKSKILMDLRFEIKNIILAQMYELGTISKNFYEDINITKECST